MFWLDKIIHLRSTLENKNSQNKQNWISILIGIQKPPEAFKIPK